MKLILILILACMFSGCASYEFSQRAGMSYGITVNGVTVPTSSLSTWWANAKEHPAAAITSLVTDGAAAYAAYKAGMAVWDKLKPSNGTASVPTAIPGASQTIYNSGTININQ